MYFCFIFVSVRVSIENRWHNYIRIIQGGLIYKGAMTKGNLLTKKGIFGRTVSFLAPITIKPKEKEGRGY